MNENLENQLAKVVEKSLQLAEQTGDFVIEKAPDLLREFYAWHTASHILGVLISITILMAIYKLRKVISKPTKEDYYETKIGNRYYETDEIPFILYCVIGGASALIFLIMFCIEVIGLIKIIVAPKIYLIEYFLN